MDYVTMGRQERDSGAATSGKLRTPGTGRFEMGSVDRRHRGIGPATDPGGRDPEREEIRGSKRAMAQATTAPIRRQAACRYHPVIN
jgi:hypothetical protein